MISAPLRSSTSPRAPLVLSLSLATLPAPARPVTAPPIGDIFESLDSARGSRTLEDEQPATNGLGGHGDGDDERTRASPEAVSALADWTPTLFPGVTPGEGGENAPEWLSGTSGKVTALTTARVSLPRPGPGEGGAGRTRTELRAAVGCEDGSLWLFAPPPPPATPPELDHHPREQLTESPRSPIAPPFTIPTLTSTPDSPINGSRKLSLESLSPSPAPSSPSTSSPPTSPRPHSVRSKQSSSLGMAAKPPTIGRRSSNTSIALSSRRLPSPSPTPTSDSSAHHTRPRKASATVSVTTPSNDTPFPQHTHSVIASPSPPSLVLPTASHTKRHRSRASIATGIGLWEHESLASTSVYDGGPHSPDAEEEDRTFGEELGESLRKLLPVVRIRLGGWGKIANLRIVEGTRFGKEEGGKVLLVLRRSGLLSVHSLLDGREFGSCDVGEHVPAGRNAVVAFEGMEVLTLEDGLVSICYGASGVGFVAVDLDTLRPQAPVECASSLVRPATIFKQGVHFLIFASSPTSSTSATGEPQPPQLLVGPVISEPANTTNTDPDAAHPLGAVRIEAPHSVGPLVGLSGFVLGILTCADDLLAFDSMGVLLFTIRDQRIVTLGVLSLPGITNVCVEGYHAVLISTATSLFCYKLDPAQVSGRAVFNFVLLETQPLSKVDYSAVLPLPPTAASGSSDFLIARSTPGGVRVLESISVSRRSTNPEGLDGGPSFVTNSLYESRAPHREQVTCALKLDRERVLLGYSTGVVSVVRYADLEASTEPPKMHAQLAGAITVLKTYDLGNRPIIIAGASDGSAAAWDLNDWQPLAHWSLFASPVSHIVPITTSPSSGLSHALALVSANSPIALVSLFPPQLHFVLPGTKSPVERIATSGDEMLVVYAHGLARVCHIEGLELRRSMDLRTAAGVLAEGKWTTWFSLADLRTTERPSPTAHEPFLTVDLREDIEDALRLLPWAEARRSVPAPAPASEVESCDLVSDTKNSRDQLGLVRLLLSQVLTWGLDQDTDELLVDNLSIERPAVQLASAVQSSGAISISASHSPTAPWTLSSTATAQRLLHIVCLLRVFLNFPDTERYASQAIVFYASFLADSVGSAFAFPALEVLADYWLDGSTEVQQAARLLFGSYLGAATDDRILALVERWEDLLPSRQPAGSNHHASSDQAVLILGLVAAEKFKLLPAVLFKDISESITSFLADDGLPYHQAIATELCTRGFEIWQNYVDAMPLVRQLFGLATGRTAATPNDLRNLARLATLHVAGVNTPLFMTTLSFDILNAQSAAHRNATMKLLGFMVRKKPLVLYTSLPRLAEAVVKSLDPTVTSMRESVQQAATVILNELVRTYPSIDFHGSSQRLAVGTHEGATIVYDLKTATRLYVLEGHTRAITALSWSPDGRRLVSVSLEESRVVVWKVGVGILSMFTPGAPPRQGSGGTATPFKTLDFAVGDEAHMTTAATLEWVAFEWPTDRTTRLKIRESALTFAV